MEEVSRSRIRDTTCRLHFVGVAGSGMSALAQYRAFGGGAASGSDRAIDRGSSPQVGEALERAGVRLHPQDGSAVKGAGLVVASTAVEAEVADLVAAREHGVPVIHRSDLLAFHVSESSAIAVTGTSGKSTVAAMLFEILSGTGRDPGLITGGALSGLCNSGFLGNAWRGDGPLIVEADESDGTVVRYVPTVGIILNLHRDHEEPAVVLEMFRTFRQRTTGAFVVSDDPALADLRAGALVFGFGPDAELRASSLELGPDSSVFKLAGVRVHVPVPGAHNARNALAALAACRALELPVAEAASALTGFAGVSRRFQLVGHRGGVEVVDDFAHNPVKIQAAILTAQGRAARVHTVFQPHGFAPTAFYREELVETLATTLRSRDTLTLLPILYAGGSAQRVIDSRDLASDLKRRRVAATLVDREALPGALAGAVEPGDLVLLMGARDPSLPLLARNILEGLPERE